MSTTITETRVYDYAYAVDGLNQILDKYPDNSDFLSRDLHNWAGNLSEEAFEKRLADPQEQMMVAIRHIGVLFFEVVINPLNKMPLSDPVVERNWVWERKMHQEWRERYKGISPLDGLQMAENPVPHSFAKEIIAWGADLLSNMPLLNRQIILRHQMDMLDDNQMVERALHERGERVEFEVGEIVSRQHMHLRAKMDDTLDEFMDELSLLEISNQDLIQRVNRRLQNQEESLDQQIEAYQTTTVGIVKDLARELSVKEEQHQQTIANYESRIVEEQKAATALTTVLQSNLNRVEAASSSAIQTMGQHLAMAVKIQKETEAQLNNMVAYTQTISNEVTVLESQVAANRQNLVMTEQQLQSKEGQIRHLASETQHLTALREQEERDLRYATQKAKEIKKKRCVVM